MERLGVDQNDRLTASDRLTPTETEKHKKKKNLAQDVKDKFAMLRRHGDASPTGGGGRESRAARPTADAVRSWSRSLDNLLNDKDGLDLFREFLRSEFSEENLEFWIACEEYKTVSADQLTAQSQRIYTDFVAIQAPREINLDSKTREQTCAKISHPDLRTFEVAQKRIQALMEKDSYPRFLRSDVYRSLLSQHRIHLGVT